MLWKKNDIGEEQMYLNKVQEKALIKWYFEVIVRHDILSVYSKDLTKNTVAVSKLSCYTKSLDGDFYGYLGNLSRYNETITTVDGKKRRIL